MGFWDFAADLPPEAFALDSWGFCILDLLTITAPSQILAMLLVHEGTVAKW